MLRIDFKIVNFTFQLLYNKYNESLYSDFTLLMIDLRNSL